MVGPVGFVLRDLFFWLERVGCAGEVTLTNATR